MSTQATIEITPGVGQFLDAVSLIIGATTVVRETMVIADPSNATYLATVTPGGALNVTDAVLDGCITANVLAVALPSAQITTLTPPTASAIGTAVSTDLLIGTQLAAVSVPVALPLTTITTLTPPSASAIAAAIVANPPTVSIVGNVGVTQSTTPWIVAGNLTHNNAAPSTKNLGALVGLANTAAPTLNEGDQVLLSTDLAGNLRVVTSGGGGTQYTDLTAESAGAFIGTAALGYNGTDVVALRMTAGNDLYVAGHLTNNNAVPAAGNIGALTALANASAPTNTEGKQTLLSVDLAGNLRVVTSGGGGTQYVDETAETAGAFTGTAALGYNGTDVVALRMNAGNDLYVTGHLTHNNAAPAATEVGVLPSVANAAVPTLTEGDQVLQSSDLQGSQRVRPGSPKTANWSQAVISCSASGANLLIAGVGGQTIRVMRIFFVNSDPVNATNITIQDSTPTSFSGAFRLITGGSFNGTDANGEPLFVTAASQGFQINSSVAVQLSGTVWYTQS